MLVLKLLFNGAACDGYILSFFLPNEQVFLIKIGPLWIITGLPRKNCLFLGSSESMYDLDFRCVSFET